MSHRASVPAIARFTTHLGLIGVTAWSSTPALAASVTTCAASDISAQPAAPLVVQPQGPQGGVFSGPMTLNVFCGGRVAGDSAGPLQGQSFTVKVANYGSAVDPATGAPITDLQGAINGGAFQNLPILQWVILADGLTSDANGQVNFTVALYSPSHADLSGVSGSPQAIGFQMDVDTSVPSPSGGLFGGGLLLGSQIYAQTPELDSLILFGSGAAGLAGYALIRRRARP